jgi:predicted house-cleaning NTP pyrophosphatase (Maf/HAM1 superfamily)
MRAAVPFTARGADVDERGIEAEMYGAAPDQIALALALAKAMAAEVTVKDKVLV